MPDMTIVNTSPIFYLHRLGLLNIFHALYGEIIVPWAVQDELEQGRKQGENVPNLDEYSWIKIRNVSVPQYMNLIVELGRGESEVLGIAAEYPSVNESVSQCVSKEKEEEEEKKKEYRQDLQDKHDIFDPCNPVNPVNLLFFLTPRRCASAGVFLLLSSSSSSRPSRKSCRLFLLFSAPQRLRARISSLKV